MSKHNVNEKEMFRAKSISIPESACYIAIREAKVKRERAKLQVASLERAIEAIEQEASATQN